MNWSGAVEVKALSGSEFTDHADSGGISVVVSSSVFHRGRVHAKRKTFPFTPLHYYCTCVHVMAIMWSRGLQLGPYLF